MISRTAEYALRAVIVLGSSPGSPLTTQQIAARTRVPSGYLSKVLQALGRAGDWSRHNAACTGGLSCPARSTG